VIFGENGRGKTGLYRAILYCLYGEMLLSQDASNDKKPSLVNIPAMEAMSSKGKSVATSVELRFTHEDQQYQLKRSILGMLENDKVIEEPNKISLIRCDKEGNTTTIKEGKDISDVINQILEKSLREYFLFDGEKIERLTRANKKQRNEVSRGIKKLLKVGTLERAIKATGQLKENLEREVENRATGELRQVMQQLRENNEQITEFQEHREEIKDEVDRARRERQEVDDRLEEIKGIQDLLQERKSSEEREKTLVKRLDSHLHKMKGQLDKMKGQLGKTALLLVRKTVENVYLNIDNRKERGEIPSDIRRDFIDRLIEEERCICGAAISPESEEYRKIMSWLDRSTDKKTENSLLNLWKSLGEVRAKYDTIGSTTIELLQDYKDDENKLQKVRNLLEKLSEEIGSSERADAANQESIRDNIDRKLLKLEEKASQIQGELVRLGENNEKHEAQCKILKKDEKITKLLSQRSDLAGKTSRALDRILKEFTEETRRLVGEKATKYFLELLDDEGQRTLRKIIVNEDYSLQVINHWDEPFLKDISAGQRQIMSIAFIAALASVAAGTDFLEMPLFMDSPFGRLLRDHRNNLSD